MRIYRVGNYVYHIEHETSGSVVSFSVWRDVGVQKDEDLLKRWPDLQFTISNYTEICCSANRLTFDGRRELADMLLVPNKCMDIYNELMVIPQPKHGSVVYHS